jgi:hypothetical protein
MKTLRCGQNLGVVREKICMCRWYMDPGKQIAEELKGIRLLRHTKDTY